MILKLKIFLVFIWVYCAIVLGFVSPMGDLDLTFAAAESPELVMVAKEQELNNVLPYTQKPSRRPLNFAVGRLQEDFKWANDPKLKRIFAPDFVWMVNVFHKREKYFEMIELLRQRNPRAIIGRYNAACLAQESRYESIIPIFYPLEKCPEGWLLHSPEGKRVPYLDRIGDTDEYKENGYFLDMRKKEVRSAVIQEMIARTLNDGLDATCYDICYWDVVPSHHPIPIDEWNNEAMLPFYKEAGYEAKKNGLLCVVNVAVPSWKIPGAVRAIVPYVDGLMLETSFHPKVIKDGILQKELDAYKWALEQGKMIFLIPRGLTLEAESFALKKVRPLDSIRQGRIFVTIGKEHISKGGKRFIHDNPLYR